MYRIIIAYSIILLSTFSLVAQDTNPFEIYRNGDSSRITDRIFNETAAADTINPYELLAKSPSTKRLDSAQLTDEASSSNTVSSVILDNDAIDGDNPFELGRSTNSAAIIASEGSIKASESEMTPAVIPSTKTKNGNSNNSFIFWFLLLSVLLLTAGITSNRKSFKNLYRLISNQNYLKLQNREQKGGKNVFYTLLYGAFVLNISIFSYLGYSYMTGISHIGTLLKIIIIVTVVYGLRHFLLNFLKYFVDSKYLVSDYDFTITVINVILGLILLPIVLFTGFSGFTYVGLVIGAVVIVLLYFTRQLKGVMAAMDSNETGLFHFFIYLCTFEIGPILIAVRLLKDYSGIM